MLKNKSCFQFKQCFIYMLFLYYNVTYVACIIILCYLFLCLHEDHKSYYVRTFENLRVYFFSLRSPTPSLVMIYTLILLDCRQLIKFNCSLEIMVFLLIKNIGNILDTKVKKYLKNLVYTRHQYILNV